MAAIDDSEHFNLRCSTTSAPGCRVAAMASGQGDFRKRMQWLRGRLEQRRSRSPEQSALLSSLDKAAPSPQADRARHRLRQEYNDTSSPVYEGWRTRKPLWLREPSDLPSRATRTGHVAQVKGASDDIFSDTPPRNPNWMLQRVRTLSIADTGSVEDSGSDVEHKTADAAESAAPEEKHMQSPMNWAADIPAACLRAVEDGNTGRWILVPVATQPDTGNIKTRTTTGKDERPSLPLADVSEGKLPATPTASPKAPESPHRALDRHDAAGRAPRVSRHRSSTATQDPPFSRHARRTSTSASVWLRAVRRLSSPSERLGPALRALHTYAKPLRDSVPGDRRTKERERKQDDEHRAEGGDAWYTIGRLGEDDNENNGEEAASAQIPATESHRSTASIRCSNTVPSTASEVVLPLVAMGGTAKKDSDAPPRDDSDKDNDNVVVGENSDVLVTGRHREAGSSRDTAAREHSQQDPIGDEEFETDGLLNEREEASSPARGGNDSASADHDQELEECGPRVQRDRTTPPTPGTEFSSVISANSVLPISDTPPPDDDDNGDDVTSGGVTGDQPVDETSDTVAAGHIVPPPPPPPPVSVTLIECFKFFGRVPVRPPPGGRHSIPEDNSEVASVDSHQSATSFVTIRWDQICSDEPWTAAQLELHLASFQAVFRGSRVRRVVRPPLACVREWREMHAALLRRLHDVEGALCDAEEAARGTALQSAWNGLVTSLHLLRVLLWPLAERGDADSMAPSLDQVRIPCRLHQLSHWWNAMRVWSQWMPLWSLYGRRVPEMMGSLERMPHNVSTERLAALERGLLDPLHSTRSLRRDTQRLRRVCRRAQRLIGLRGSGRAGISGVLTAKVEQDLLQWRQRVLWFASCGEGPFGVDACMEATVNALRGTEKIMDDAIRSAEDEEDKVELREQLPATLVGGLRAEHLDSAWGVDSDAITPQRQEDTSLPDQSFPARVELQSIPPRLYRQARRYGIPWERLMAPGSQATRAQMVLTRSHLVAATSPRESELSRVALPGVRLASRELNTLTVLLHSRAGWSAPGATSENEVVDDASSFASLRSVWSLRWDSNASKDAFTEAFFRQQRQLARAARRVRRLVERQHGTTAVDNWSALNQWAQHLQAQVAALAQREWELVLQEESSGIHQLTRLLRLATSPESAARLTSNEPNSSNAQVRIESLSQEASHSSVAHVMSRWILHMLDMRSTGPSIEPPGSEILRTPMGRLLIRMCEASVTAAEKMGEHVARGATAVALVDACIAVASLLHPGGLATDTRSVGEPFPVAQIAVLATSGSTGEWSHSENLDSYLSSSEEEASAQSAEDSDGGSTDTTPEEGSAKQDGTSYAQSPWEKCFRNNEVASALRSTQAANASMFQSALAQQHRPRFRGQQRLQIGSSLSQMWARDAVTLDRTPPWTRHRDTLLPLLELSNVQTVWFAVERLSFLQSPRNRGVWTQWTPHFASFASREWDNAREGAVRPRGELCDLEVSHMELNLRDVASGSLVQSIGLDKIVGLVLGFPDKRLGPASASDTRPWLRITACLPPVELIVRGVTIEDTESAATLIHQRMWTM